jgi:hypothetical protein
LYYAANFAPTSVDVNRPQYFARRWSHQARIVLSGDGHHGFGSAFTPRIFVSNSADGGNAWSFVGPISRSRRFKN